MDTNKNSYTIIYSTVLVVVVAAVLAYASQALKPRQQRNIEIETKSQILKSVNLVPDAATVKDKASYVEGQYSKYIKDSSIAVNGDSLKIYICTFDNADKAYIVPVNGTGLWGPIWGYIAFKSDFNTIYGTTFAHQGETPGLGAEIATDWFAAEFKDKQIFDAGKFVSVQVVKGGADKSNPHQVDAISGGTITSKALQEMLLKGIGKYISFFESRLKAQVSAPKDSVSQPADSLSNTANTLKNE